MPRSIANSRCTPFIAADFPERVTHSLGEAHRRIICQALLGEMQYYSQPALASGVCSLPANHGRRYRGTMGFPAMRAGAAVWLGCLFLSFFLHAVCRDCFPFSFVCF